MKGAIQTVGAVFLVTVLASWAAALEIQVAPQMLVLSSAGGKLTVHTDVRYQSEAEVFLSVDGKELEPEVEFWTFADNQGNLVAQCTKETVEQLLEGLDWDKKFEEVEVTLNVNGDGATEVITVKQ